MKKRHICAVFSLSIFRFVIFALRNEFVSSANEYWFGVESWFVVGCFIADEYFFVGECFYEGDSEGWRSGLIELGDGWVLAEGVLTRACIRAPVLGVLFFCCHKCHNGWGWKCFITPKTTCRFIESDVWFCWKQRVVLLKTTYHFTENIVSFYWKQRVVLWKVTGCFRLEVEKLFWGWCFGKFLGWSSSVKVWYFLNVVSVIGVNGYYIMGYSVCVTLVTAKNTKLL